MSKRTVPASTRAKLSTVSVREITQELVNLNGQQPLRRHRLHVPVDRVDDDHSGVIALDDRAYRVGELAWRHLRRLDLMDVHQALLLGVSNGHAERFGAREEGRDALVEQKEMHTLASPCRREPVLRAQHGFASTSGSGDQRARSHREPAADQTIEVR